MKLIVEKSSPSFDELLEMVDMVSKYDFENFSSASTAEKMALVKEYKPLLAYFAFDDEGNKLPREEAETLIGKTPAIEILPYTLSLQGVLEELFKLMSSPPVNSGSLSTASTPTKRSRRGAR